MQERQMMDFVMIAFEVMHMLTCQKSGKNYLLNLVNGKINGNLNLNKV